MHSCKVRVIKTNFPDSGTVDIYKVDNSIWQTSFFQYPHDHLSGIDLRIGAFPYDHIAAKSCRSWKIAPDRGKVEWCYRQYKSFEWAIFHSVVHTRTTNWLLLVYLGKKMNVETQEIDQFAGRINFCLVSILALTQHRCSVHVRPVFRGHKIGCP